MRKLSLTSVSLLVLGIISVSRLGCSDNPTASVPTAGTIKVSIKTSNTGLPKATASSTITSVRMVIHEVELESSVADTLDYEFEQPFLQDLLVGANIHVIETLEVPFGSYSEIAFKMDDLESDDGVIYVQNPELQERSILIKGFLNGDPTQTFVFASDISQDQKRQFDPPILLDENSSATNIVLAINMDMWFLDENGNFLDPRNTNNKSAIENTIKDSIKVFEDEDDDGEEDVEDDA